MSRKARAKVSASAGLNVAGLPLTMLPWRRWVSHWEVRPKYLRATSLKLMKPHISRAASHVASAFDSGVIICSFSIVCFVLARGLKQEPRPLVAGLLFSRPMRVRVVRSACLFHL